jgi:hypothetical protein
MMLICTVIKKIDFAAKKINVMPPQAIPFSAQAAQVLA